MAEITERYDALVLDAVHKQSLASARSLGRAGLRVALKDHPQDARVVARFARVYHGPWRRAHIQTSPAVAREVE